MIESIHMSVFRHTWLYILSLPGTSKSFFAFDLFLFLFLVATCFVVAFQPCMECIPEKREENANIKSSIKCQDWIELWCWFFVYRFASIEIANWFSWCLKLILSSFTVKFRFSSFVAKILSANHIAWFFYIKSPERLSLIFCAAV